MRGISHAFHELCHLLQRRDNGFSDILSLLLHQRQLQYET